MTNLEFSNLIILKHVLKLISCQRPDPISIFSRVLGDYLSIQFVKFNEIRPSQAEVLEQLLTLEHFLSRLKYVLQHLFY